MDVLISMFDAMVDWLAHGFASFICLGACALHAGHDAHHDRRRDDLPAPRPGASRTRPARHPLALLPPLALARHRHGDQGVGRDPPQAPRQVRDRRRSAQPADARHQDRAPARQRALSHRSEEPGNAGQIRPRHARRLARAQSLRALQLAGRRPDADHQPVPVRRRRRDGLGHPDGLDPDHGCRHRQRHRPLVGLPQFRGARRQPQRLAVGHHHRRRGAAQQPSHLPDLGQAVGQAVRVRHRLDVHPRSRDARPGHRAQDAAAAASSVRSSRSPTTRRSKPSSPTATRSWRITRAACVTPAAPRSRA